MTSDRELAPGGAVLEVRGLTVDYGVGGGALHAVRGVDLTLERGQVLGVAGESGSGKSTLAYAMTRLLRPPGRVVGGQVRYLPRPGSRPQDPVEVLTLSDEELRRFRWDEVAMVFQSAMNALNPVMDIQTQLTDVLVAHRPAMSAAERRVRAGELLALVGIADSRLTSYPHELSGGMRQRVMIAMAMALEPEIIVMDEPTTALDVVMQRQILGRIMALRERLGFAVVFITHDLSLLIELADSIAVMYAGKVVEQGSARDLYRSPLHPYTEGLLSSFPSLHGARHKLEGIPGHPPDLRQVPIGCAFAPRCPKVMPVCKEEPILTGVGADSVGGGRKVACWLNAAGEPRLAGGTAGDEAASRRRVTTP